MKFWVKEIFSVMALLFNLSIFEEIPADVFEDGQPVAHEHFPFIVSIQEWEGQWVHICVGNIVDHRNVLTAYQCVRKVQNNTVKRKDAREMRVYAGSGDMDCGSVLERYAMVRNFTAHPRVSSNVNGSVAFDLALLLLDRDLEFNYEILPMNLPAADTTVHSRASCYSPGWGGRWGESHSSKNLTLVEYHRIPRSLCYNTFCQLFAMCSEDLQKQEQTCAVNKKPTSGFTDVGSPLVCHGFIYGMATFRAGPNSPTIFTGLNPILEMVHGLEELPQTHKPMKKVENDTARAVRALEERKKLEEWMRMLSSSQLHQATTLILALECLLALPA